MFLFPNVLVIIKGGGDLGTGAAWRLHKAGLPVVVTELAQPLVVRRTVAFASAVYEGEIAVEGVTAWKARDVAEARGLLADGIIPVLVDEGGAARAELKPAVLVDAVLAKRNTGTTLQDAPFVIALGPGFTPNVDCHCVVETMRGHYLGRVWWSTPALPNTGVPGEVGGKGTERVLRAPADGTLTGLRRIGDRVTAGEVVARVNDADLKAPFDGVLRGLVHDGLAVKARMKVGDVDPRAEREHCFTISDKALAVGGGALQAVMEWMQLYKSRD
ncbi:MAG: selenium-dependent molybdenum cofactor biosynthesis protein YqeB [Anaerolineae bacterium]